VNSTLPIGDFSRATHLSVKMLRHYGSPSTVPHDRGPKAGTGPTVPFLLPFLSEARELWELRFPAGSLNVTPNALYFTAGPNDEADGLLGDIVPAQS